jgi:MFS family permease
VPSYFVRAFGLGLAQVGLITGLIGGFSAGIGTLVGGFLSDWAGKRSVKWYAWVPAIGLIICTPIYILAYLQSEWQATAMILLVPGIFHYVYLAPTFAVVQNSVEPRRRATATALLFFFLNLIALGGGPVFTGWLIDHLAQYHFNTSDAAGVVHSVLASFGAEGGQNFAASCPGGIAPKGSAPELAVHCRTTLALSSQQGIIVSLCFYAWAGVHYALAAIGMVKHMKSREPS